MGSQVTNAEKAALMDTLNRMHGTTVPVEVIEIAITYGFTSWELLQKEAKEAVAKPCGCRGEQD